jgi:deoxyribose-phosphate aldolase
MTVICIHKSHLRCFFSILAAILLAAFFRTCAN